MVYTINNDSTEQQGLYTDSRDFTVVRDVCKSYILARQTRARLNLITRIGALSDRRTNSIGKTRICIVHAKTL